MTASGRIGKYELVEFLGGGMSHVYRAQDTVLGRTVAIKILTEAACTEPEAKARFLAEARLASNFSHDNVLGIYDFGEDDQHRPFMVMEFLRGQTVRSAIQKGETGDLDGKLHIALQAARALEYLHSQKVIHRDVKPENMHINSSGVLKLMDFGIAKTQGLNMTRPGFVVGTPYYMAPEQIRGEKLTEQADVYAYGVFLFELMTGMKPISGDTVERIFYLILNEPLDLAPLAASGAPEAICDLVSRCTAKDPVNRPGGFGPVRAAIEELLAAPGAPVSDKPSEVVPQPVAEVVPETKPEPAARRKRGWFAVWPAAAALLGLLAVGSSLAWTGYFRLNARIRSAAHAISTAGTAPDKLVSSGALTRIDNLRTDLDTLDRYRRQGAPLGYRLGSLVRGDLYRPARKLYFDLFQSSFLGPVHDNQLRFLRSLPAKPGPPYGLVYETLKAYLMTTSKPAKADAYFLVPVLLRWWGPGFNAGPDSGNVVRRQFEFYATELAQDDPFPADTDAEAVRQARQYLSQFADADRVYVLLLAEAAKHSPPVNFNRQFAGSERVLAQAYEVPGPFAKAGWVFVKDAIAHPESHFAAESWVAGESEAATDPLQLAEYVTRRYREDFVNAWRQYLRSGSFARFASPADAGQKLDGLARENSALEQWLSLAALNTAVDAADVAHVFQAARDAQAAGPRVRGLYSGLSASLRKAAGQGTAPSGAAPAETLALIQQDIETTTQMAASFHRDTEGHIETQVTRMLQEPIVATRTVLNVGGPAQWNARGSDLCSRMKPVLSKYPFTPGASAQASVQEVISLFRPADGLLWKFYSDSLQKLIQRDGQKFVANASAGLAMNPAFLSFLDRAAAFSSAAFAGGASQPKFRYTLRPVMPPDIESVKLTIDGQSATFRRSAAAKAFTWPGSGAQEMRVSVRFKGKGEYNWSKSATPWSVLLFFDGATRRQGAQIEIPLHGETPAPAGQPASLWFEVAATPPIFDEAYFSGVVCEAGVVKP